MSEIQMIKERHSVRSYSERKIEKNLLDQLNAKIAECNEKGNLNIQLLEDAGKTFNKLMNIAVGLGSAPSVIACIGPDDETLDERIGYYGEQIVLLAQELGLNTCWAGTYNPKNVEAKINAGERLAIVIALGYGTNPGKEHRSKSINDVVKANKELPDWVKVGAEMALLAPTAINQQKFEIIYNDDDTYEIVDKGGVLSKIDLGIVKYHFEVGASSVRK